MTTQQTELEKLLAQDERMFNLMNTKQTDKATAIEPRLTSSQEEDWEKIQDRYSELTDKYLALKLELDALNAIKEAANELELLLSGEHKNPNASESVLRRNLRKALSVIREGKVKA